MKPLSTRPGIPSPLGVADPMVLRSLVAMREAIEYLTAEVVELKRQVDATPKSLMSRSHSDGGVAPRFGPQKDD